VELYKGGYMSAHHTEHNELVYYLEDRPGVIVSSFVAIQHVLTSFISIITPTLIIGGVLGLDEHIPYLISMALMVSGVATLIQAVRPIGIGSGLLCVQGTSFAFLSAILATGLIAKTNGGGPDEILSLIFLMCFFGAFVEIFLSQVIIFMKRIITPLVTGTVVILIGISLIKVGMTDLAGGLDADDFGSLQNLMLGVAVLLTVIFLNQFNTHWLRISSIAIGLMVGYLLAIAMGMVDLASVEAIFANGLGAITVPLPFKYGFNISLFDWSTFLPIALIYLVTTIETMGDITANSVISGLAIRGTEYRKRIKGGVLADGVNSLIAAVFSAFPNTVLSQNNGVIQLTGIASRHIAYFIAVFLILLGLFPVVGSVLQTIPKPVLGAVTLLMFATIIASGIKILKRVPMSRRNMLVIAVSLGFGLGVMLVPEVISQLPQAAQNILGSAITMGGLTAIFLNLFIPKRKDS